jgi:hypothetical protein
LLVKRFEDIRLRAGGQPAQKARHFFIRLNKRFKNAWISALLAQHAGGTGLLRAHDANRAAQGMAKGAAQQ